MQLSLLDLMRQPAERTPVDPDGSVVQGAVDVTLILPHPHMAWSLARIELHRHASGRWMWGTGLCGAGYRVGEKWGRFAATLDDAAHYGAQEILGLARKMKDAPSHGVTSAQVGQIIAWAQAIADDPAAHLTPAEQEARHG